MSETATQFVREVAAARQVQPAHQVDDFTRYLHSVTPPFVPSVSATQSRGATGEPDASGRPSGSEAAEAIALAREEFGDPQPLTLLRQEGALRVIGWMLGRGRAECREAGQLAHIVGIDIILVADGRFAVSERTATDGVDGLSRLEARCEFFDSAQAARSHCERMSGDSTREAARVAALDHATRRWRPFRGTPHRGVKVAAPLPFHLD